MKNPKTDSVDLTFFRFFLLKIRIGWLLWYIKVQIVNSIQSTLIFSRVRVFHLEGLKKRTWLHSLRIYKRQRFPTLQTGSRSSSYFSASMVCWASYWKANIGIARWRRRRGAYGARGRQRYRYSPLHRIDCCTHCTALLAPAIPDCYMLRYYQHSNTTHHNGWMDSTRSFLCQDWLQSPPVWVP